MQAVRSVVGVELVLDTVQREPGTCHPVCDAANDRTEVGGIVSIVLDGIVAQDHTHQSPVTVRRQDRHDDPTVIREADHEAGVAGKREYARVGAHPRITITYLMRPFSTLSLVVAFAQAAAAQQAVTSPDGRTIVTVEANNGGLFYRVDRDRKPLLM